MPDCYKEGMQLFAYRYFGYSHVVSQDMVPMGESQSQDNEIKDLVSVDSNVVNPAIVQNFLCNGLENEVAGFVENYLQMVGESALKSKMFRQYILLNIHFCIVSFLQKLGYEKDVIDHSLLETSGMGQPLDHDKIAASISGALKQALQLREEKSKGKYQNVLQNAVQYMEENFAECNILHEETVKKVKQKMPEDGFIYDLAELFKVFADSTRMKIIYALLEDCLLYTSDAADEL